MRSRILQIIFAFSPILVAAQPAKEAWHWFFGDSCSLNFASGIPIPSFGPINVVEGTAACSDPSTGQLLFLTDGTTVWDKNLVPMPNGSGLYGGYGTSSQAVLVIPKPGSANIFYLITADQGGYRPQPVHGVNYSVLDLNLNGGLGDIAVKNQPLTPPPTTEKLVGVKHCNESDYWVITHSFLSDAFNAYKITSAGIDTIPIISHVGTIHNDGGPSVDSLGTIGCMKASPDGRKLAVAVPYHVPMIEVFDFNPSSGVVSNPLKLSYSNLGSSCGPYGVAFSPDSKKLYATFETYCTSNFKPAIIQFDISNYNLSSVLASKIRIDSVQHPGAMQLGPDGKLYVSVYNGTSISVINNPNSSGVACNFQPNAINLFMGSKAKLGLPNFIDTQVSTPSIIQQYTVSLCSFASYTLTVSGGTQYQWSNNDTSASSIISAYGTYWVTLNTFGGCLERDSFYVAPKTPPSVNVLHDTAVCSNSPAFPVQVNASFPGTLSYNWSDGFSAPMHTVLNPGTYYVHYTFPDLCTAIDSFDYVIHSLPSVSAGRDTSVCAPSTSVTLNATTSASSFQWNTAQTTLQIEVSDSGLYWITVYDGNGCESSDSVRVDFITPPLINVLKDTAQCTSALSSFQVDASFPNTVSYLWSDSSTNPVRNITTPGYYQVQYQLSNGCIANDGFLYSEIPNPQVNLGSDTTFCFGEKILDAGNSGSSFYWSNGSVSQQTPINSPGLYWVMVNSFGCIGIDSLLVSPDLNQMSFTMPNIVTANGDGINDEIDFGKFNFSELQVDIYNRWGAKVFEGNNPLCKWQPSVNEGTYYCLLNYKMSCGNLSQSETVQIYITVIK